MTSESVSSGQHLTQIFDAMFILNMWKEKESHKEITQSSQNVLHLVKETVVKYISWEGILWEESENSHEMQSNNKDTQSLNKDTEISRVEEKERQNNHQETSGLQSYAKLQRLKHKMTT